MMFSISFSLLLIILKVINGQSTINPNVTGLSPFPNITGSSPFPNITAPSVSSLTSCKLVLVCINNCTNISGSQTTVGPLNSTGLANVTGPANVTRSPIIANCDNQNTSSSCCNCFRTCANNSNSNVTPKPSGGKTDPPNAPTNLFNGFDKRLAQILISMLGFTPANAAATAIRGPEAVADLLNSLKPNDWIGNCPIALLYYQYLEDIIVNNNSFSSFVTYDKLNPILICKMDCNFNRLLSKQSTFTSNCTPGVGANNCSTNDFAKNVVKFLRPEAAAQCRNVFTSLKQALPSASTNPGDLANTLKGDPNQISFLSPVDLGKMAKNQSNALAVAQALGSSNIKLSPIMAKTLAANLPNDTNLTSVASLASGLPLGVFANAPPSDIISSLSKMDVSNMNPFVKGFISSQIAKRNNSDQIKSFLQATSDSTLVNGISTSQLQSLNLKSLSDIQSIPPNNLPKAFLKSVSRSTLVSSTLDSIAFSNASYAKLLPGVISSDLKNISSDSARITAINNLVMASQSQLVNMTSNQRAFFLDSLLNSMKTSYATTNLTQIISFLTTSDATNLFPLFIEANSTILTEFVKFESFAYAISGVSKLSSSQCCSFSRVGLQRFAALAASYSFSYTNLALENLYSLGPCISGNLPYSVMSNISVSTFVSYYSTIGSAFQPDANQVALTQANIQSYVNTLSASSIDTFVFSTLSDLAMFFPWTTTSITFANSTWTTSGGSLLSTMIAARSPSVSSNQLCQFGLTNTATFTSLINNYAVLYANNYIALSSSARRRKRAVALTCSTLSNIGSPAIGSISADQLATLTDFSSCITLLGNSANSWSSSQLTSLISLAKQYFLTASNVTDSSITQMNSLMLGFTGSNQFVTSDLSSLSFTTTTSISTLGALSGWTNDQINALATPLTNYINANTITSDFMSSAGNLLCALTTNQINAISVSQFSVSSLSKITISCQNMATWYAYATNNITSYQNAATSSSALTELGSVIAGISQTDIALVSADVISSISSSAWTNMPAATVNKISSSALSGLSTESVSALLSNPNSNSFSSAITSTLNSAAGITTTNTGDMIRYNSLLIILLSSLLALLIV